MFVSSSVTSADLTSEKNHKKFEITITFLPLPPKVDGGYVFIPVCLSVCRNISKR